MAEAPRPNRRRMVGNEFVAGSALQPGIISRQAVFNNAEQLRNRLIETAAKPPVLPLPQPINTPPISKVFNQIAYSLLLTGLLGAISSATEYTNWAFLTLGIIAVLVRLSSQLLFAAALLSLVMIPVTTTLEKGGLANVFAVMTFYFLLIGLIRAVLEERRLMKNREKEAKKHKRQHR